MASSPPSLRQRLAELGCRLGEREAPHREAREAARKEAERLRAATAEALEAFHAAAAERGAPYLRVELSAVQPDEKHLRALQFALRRGRHEAVVTVRSRGEVTLVGPYQRGRAEGPCKTFPAGGGEELGRALGAFLERFLEEAARP